MNVPQQGGEVNSFPWDEDLLDELQASFSSERLGTYVKAARGDRAKALHLYTWNTAISAAFYGPLQGLEVALRNAMHRRLTECYGSAWYDKLCGWTRHSMSGSPRRCQVGSGTHRSSSRSTSNRRRTLFRFLDFVARSRRFASTRLVGRRTMR